MSKNDTWRFSCSFPFDDRDTVEGQIYLSGMAGCEESEDGEIVTFRVYFMDPESAEACRAELEEAGVTCLPVEAVVQQDWNEKWRESMEPARLTDTVWVSPEWLPPPMVEGDFWIKIEPKMAFGTGHHETTRLAGKAIMNYAGTKGSLLDIGTGSGVLCFAARLAGFTRSVGVEIDIDCAENLAENIVLNNMGDAVFCTIGTLDTIKPESFDCIVMNMIRTESDPCVMPSKAMLNKGGVIIRSGILVDEKEKVIAWMQERGFALDVEDAENDWWSGVFSVVE